MGAYPAQDSGKRRFFNDQLAGLIHFTLGNQPEVAGDINAGRAGTDAQRLIGGQFLGPNAAKGSGDIQNFYAVGTGILTPSAGCTKPGHGGCGNFIDQIQLNMPDQPSYIKSVDTGDGAG